jgi:predicted RNA-binding protein with PIN domain
MPVIIDGYNLLWAIQHTGRDMDEYTDLQMCFILGRYFKSKGETGQVVFDGTGPPDKETFFNIEWLDVRFVGFSTDADTVIINKIHSSSAPKNLEIVTNDREIKDAGRRRKTKITSSENFWNKVQKTLSLKEGQVKEPHEKQHGISEAETDMWMKYFGLDDD